MGGKQRTRSVSGTEIVVTAKKADDTAVFVLFLTVSGHEVNLGSRN